MRKTRSVGNHWRLSAVVAGASVCLTLAVASSPAGATITRPTSLSASPAEVLSWNQIAVQTGLAAGQTNQEGILHLAYVQSAVFDAVDALDGGYRPYVGQLRAHGPTDGDAAVAAAAHRMLVTQFPTQSAALDTDYATALAAIPDGSAKARGIALGENAAADVIDARANDGFEANVPYTFGSGPGVWVLPTDNPVTTPATPWVAKMTPFIMRTHDQYRPGPPPALTSDAYTASFNETKAYGAAASTVRDAAQTDIALFWGLGRPDAQYNEAVRGIVTAVGMSRVDAARALAMINLVAADAYIACFDAKYTYSAWRPYTAIRAADTRRKSQHRARSQLDAVGPYAEPSRVPSQPFLRHDKFRQDTRQLVRSAAFLGDDLRHAGQHRIAPL